MSLTTSLTTSHTTRDFTATTFVVDGDRTLLLFHKALQEWFPPGGHIHQDELPCEAAVREVREESGLEVELLSQRVTMGRVEVLPQPECILLEQIAPDHQHIDLIYFAICLDNEPACINLREAREGRWITAADLASAQDIHEDIQILGLRALAAASS